MGCGLSLAGIAGSISTRGIDVCLLCFVLSGRGVVPSVVSVTECDRETSATRMPTPTTAVEP